MSARRLALSVAVAGLFAAPPAVQAHALLRRADPPVGATVTASPPALSLEFTEPLDAQRCRIDVEDPAGNKITTGALRQSAARRLDVELPPLPPGRYRVHWQVVAADGHATSGGFSFAVTAP